jgi:hypothetical protein
MDMKQQNRTLKAARLLVLTASYERRDHLWEADTRCRFLPEMHVLLLLIDKNTGDRREEWRVKVGRLPGFGGHSVTFRHHPDANHKLTNSCCCGVAKTASSGFWNWREELQ